MRYYLNHPNLLRFLKISHFIISVMTADKSHLKQHHGNSRGQTRKAFFGRLSLETWMTQCMTKVVWWALISPTQKTKQMESMGLTMASWTGHSLRNTILKSQWSICGRATWTAGDCFGCVRTDTRWLHTSTGGSDRDFGRLMATTLPRQLLFGDNPHIPTNKLYRHADTTKRAVLTNRGQTAQSTLHIAVWKKDTTQLLQ